VRVRRDLTMVTNVADLLGTLPVRSTFA